MQLKYLLIYSFCIIECLFLFSSCSSQTQALRNVGGPCEGCKALYEFGDKPLTSVDTMFGFNACSTKLLLSGTVYDESGNLAPDIILYLYHTDEKGLYTSSQKNQTWATRHGDRRTWMKSDENGEYKLYTCMPAAYPNLNEPAHIHITVKEKNTIPYYIDSVVFSEDSLVTQAYRRNSQDRGGSGIVDLIVEGNLLVAKRDIVLGKNIPDYK